MTLGSSSDSHNGHRSKNEGLGWPHYRKCGFFAHKVAFNTMIPLSESFGSGIVASTSLLPYRLSAAVRSLYIYK